MSAFTAKVVQVGTEKVQTSSKKYVLENSQSFKQKQTKSVGEKKTGHCKQYLRALHHFSPE